MSSVRVCFLYHVSSQSSDIMQTGLCMSQICSETSPCFLFLILIVAGLSVECCVCVGVCVCCMEVWSESCLICVGALRTSGMVTDSPHTGSLLSTSSKTLPTTTPGMARTSGLAAISLYLWPAGAKRGPSGASGHQLGSISSGAPCGFIASLEQNTLLSVI